MQLELDGTKWKVEFQKDKKDIVIEVDNPKQSVYIYKCTDCVVQIKGKINAFVVGKPLLRT